MSRSTTIRPSSQPVSRFPSPGNPRRPEERNRSIPTKDSYPEPECAEPFRELGTGNEPLPVDLAIAAVELAHPSKGSDPAREQSVLTILLRDHEHGPVRLVDEEPARAVSGHPARFGDIEEQESVPFQDLLDSHQQLRE